MQTEPVFKLNRQALIAAIISAAFPFASHAAAGRVEFAIGNVTALGADGRERTLAKGGEINSGDTIQTADGRTQIKFTDGGYMSLQPNTQFKVDEYAYDGKADGSEKGFFKLVKGSLRAITGAIGHTNKATYRINTPVATIGIRGTELTGEYTEEGDKKELKVHVIHGSVYVENEFGDLILFQGQNGIVTDEGGKPEYGDGEPLVTAAGPDGGTPDEQQEQDEPNIFTVAEQYGSDDVPDALGGEVTETDPLASVIASYAAANAEGRYTLSTLAITGTDNVGSGTDGASSFTNISVSSGYLDVYFGEYKVNASLNIQATYSSSIYTTFVTASGGIDGTGFGLSGSGFSGMCYGSCSFNATGLFSGPTAQNAGIKYELGNLFTGGLIKGSAGFHAESVPSPGQLSSF